MRPEWQLTSPDPKAVQHLINTLKCHPAIAAILVNRSILSETAALSFLSPSIRGIRTPFELKDMDKATDRILSALEKKEKILIFGDYDADGITATVILKEFLQGIGANVSFYIPHRMEEGYGLKPQHISSMAAPGQIKLIITVDCGSDSHEAVCLAKDLSIDVIITDHHAITSEVPPAEAVVNPKRHDCPSGLDHLAGVGVVFYVMMALRKRLRDKGHFETIDEPNLMQYTDLVALGTVADIVPMIHENRAFTRAGLDIMGSGNRTGLKVLMDLSRVDCNHVNTDDIAFKLAPRLNAAGRMGHALSSVNLLMEKEAETASGMVELLEEYNTQRKTLEDKTCLDIQIALKSNPDLLNNKSLVLFHRHWHEGVLGIAASRMARKLFRPVILITTRDGMGKGSARSVDDFDLHEGLSRCKEMLHGFGGHAMAAGLTIHPDKISGFASKFEQVVMDMTGPNEFNRKIPIDFDLSFSLITEKLLVELENMMPFGKESPEPLFLSKGIKVVQSYVMGQNHRKMVLKQYGDYSNRAFSAIQFNVEPKAAGTDYFDHMLFRLRYNRWNGKKTIQILVEET